MKISRIMLALIVITLAVVAWRLLSTGLARQLPPSDKPIVAVTTYPLKEIVGHVAGDAVTLEQLIPTGTNPHDFEATPSLAETVMSADVVYAIGFGYDEWVTSLVDADTDVSNLSGNFAKRTLPVGDSATVIDPHYWLTLPNAEEMAKLAARDLGSRFPEYKSTFDANLAAYLTDLQDADDEIREMLSTTDKKSIVTQHGAWYYFADAYGLTVLDTFEQGINGEASARHLDALARAMRAAGIGTIYTDVGHEDATLTQFAADNGFTLVPIDPEGVSDPASFIDLMRSNAQAISQNS